MGQQNPVAFCPKEPEQEPAQEPEQEQEQDLDLAEQGDDLTTLAAPEFIFHLEEDFDDELLRVPSRSVYEDQPAEEDGANRDFESTVLEYPSTSDIYPVSVLDQNGTLELVVGNETGGRRLIVSSSSVKRLSPKWRTVVAGSKRTFRSRKKLRLSDDDPDMMLVFMSVAHLDFFALPTRLDFRQLVEMARICNRYNVNHIIDVLIPNWVAPHQSRLMEAGREQWLYIAHQFGMESEYIRLAKYLTVNCRVNDSKQLLIPSTSRVITGHFPDRCLAAIQYARLKMLNNFMEAMHSLVGRMIEGNSCRATDITLDPESEERTLCTLYNHGFLVRALKEQGYWPRLPNPTSIEDSVADVARRLIDLPKINVPLLRQDSGTEAFSTHFAEQHAECDASKALKIRVKHILENLVSPVESSTLDEMRRNGKKAQVDVLGQQTTAGH